MASEAKWEEKRGPRGPGPAPFTASTSRLRARAPDVRTCERGEGEGGETAPVGFGLSPDLWLCRGAAPQRRHALPCVHVLQLRVHTCHLRGGGHDQLVSNTTAV